MKTPSILTALLLIGSEILLNSASATLQARTPTAPPASIVSSPEESSDILNPTPTSQQLQAIAEQITVRVSSTNGGGSGVLIAQKGSQYLILTNKHVLRTDNTFHIQTPDGKKHIATRLPGTKIDPNYDLTLLQFNSNQKYQLAQLQFDDKSNITPLDPRRTLYTAGFPFDADKIRFSSAEISQLSDVPFNDGTQIGYVTDSGQKGIRQGMSGGQFSTFKES